VGQFCAKGTSLCRKDLCAGRTELFNYLISLAFKFKKYLQFDDFGMLFAPLRYQMIKIKSTYEIFK
jgi:hypothetical protein